MSAKIKKLEKQIKDKENEIYEFKLNNICPRCPGIDDYICPKCKAGIGIDCFSGWFTSWFNRNYTKHDERQALFDIDRNIYDEKSFLYKNELKKLNDSLYEFKKELRHLKNKKQFVDNIKRFKAKSIFAGKQANVLLVTNDYGSLVVKEVNNLSGLVPGDLVPDEKAVKFLIGKGIDVKITKPVSSKNDWGIPLRGEWYGIRD